MNKKKHFQNCFVSFAMETHFCSNATKTTCLYVLHVSCLLHFLYMYKTFKLSVLINNA